MLTLFLLLSTLTLIFLLYLNSEFRRQRKLLNAFSGPRKLPVFGNALDFRNPTGGLEKLQQLHEKFGDIIHFQIGPFLHSLLVIDAKSFEFFLGNSKVIEKSRSYKFLHSWLGNGLLTAGGTHWKNHRKIITPTFHFSILEEYVSTFNSVAKILVEKLKNEAGKNSVDIDPFINLCTLDMICETAMGIRVNAQTNSDSEYVRSVKEMCRIMIKRDQSFMSTYDCFYKLTADYRSEKRCLKVLHSFTEKIIEKRIKCPREKKTFLDLLLEAKNRDGSRAFSDVEVREEVDTFMFEAHDTTGAAIIFAIYNIAHNQDIQKEIVEEIELLLNNDINRKLTFQDLQEMKYLESVIKESLRLYPSVPIIGRRTTEDINFDGKIIPKDTDVGLFIFGLHRNPLLYPEPLRFLPERFAESTQKAYSYVPFSAGPRNCIGQKFAMLEMKATICAVLRHFRLLPAIPVHEPILVSEAVLKSANGVKIKLEMRDECKKNK